MIALRHALRSLRGRQATTLMALLSLALGVGATTAILSVVRTVLLEPLPYPQPERVVHIFTENNSESIERSRLSPVAYSDFTERLGSFESLAGWWVPDLNLTDDVANPQRVAAIDTTVGFFEVLHAPFELGTGFDPEDELVFPQTKAVISHRLWRTRYAGREDIVGDTIRLNDEAHTVVGVLPVGVDVPTGIDVIRPLGWNPANHNRGARFFSAIARLRDGVTLEQAQAEIDALAAEFAAEHGTSDEGWTFTLAPLLDDLVREVRPGLLLLLTSVGLLLVLGCVNVAGLLIASGVTRSREFSVRAALGAGRARMASQVLLESMLLGLGGAIIGFGCAQLLLRLFVAAAPSGVPRLADAHIDTVSFLTCLAALLTCTLLAGLMPALRGARSNPADALGDSVRAVGNRGATRLRAAVVVAELALATVLLLGAGLLLRSFTEVLEQGPNLATEGVLLVKLAPSPGRHARWSDVNQFYENALAATAALPGVRKTAVTGFLPTEAAWRCDTAVRGADGVALTEQPQAQLRPVSADYFDAVGLSLVAGRSFDGSDRIDSRPVVIANQAFLARYLGSAADDPSRALNQQIGGSCRGFGPLGRVLTDELEVEIVGVVEDERNTGFVDATEPALYYPLSQFAYRASTLVVKTDLEDPLLAADAVRSTIWEIDSALPVDDVATLSGFLDGFLDQRRFVVQLLVGFAGLAVLLALIGAYGVLSEMAAARRFEFGLRLSLGAKPSDLVRDLTSRALLLLAAGLVSGLVLALALRSLVQSQLFGVSVHDPTSLLATAAVLTVAALIAVARPALRAARTAPSLVLRGS